MFPQSGSRQKAQETHPSVPLAIVILFGFVEIALLLFIAGIMWVAAGGIDTAPPPAESSTLLAGAECIVVLAAAVGVAVYLQERSKSLLPMLFVQTLIVAVPIWQIIYAKLVDPMGEGSLMDFTFLLWFATPAFLTTGFSVLRIRSQRPTS